MRYIQNPPNPWLSTHNEWLGEPPEAKLEVFEEDSTRTIITTNDSPDVGFDHSVNCYRGCTHGCTYCFARPTHEYLGWGAGTDFDRKIVVKLRAPELLRKELLKPSWKGDLLAFSFTTDPYVSLEAHYQLTRRCLEVCLEFRNPVSIITKSVLIQRDIDVISKLAREASARVFFSIPFMGKEVTRALEPFASAPESRFRAMEAVANAGIPTGIAIAPVIPSLNDSDIPKLLQRAREAGADYAFLNMLRLPGSVAPYFVEQLEKKLPTKAARVLAHIREERQGKLNSSEFGSRMHGTSEQWKLAESMFKLHCRRLGLNRRNQGEDQLSTHNTFRRPSAQTSLF